MEWIAENWFLLLLLGGCVGMHFFMHRKGHHNQSEAHADESQRIQYSMATDTIEEIPQHDDELVSAHSRKTDGHGGGGCCSHHTHKYYACQKSLKTMAMQINAKAG